jgi:putative SOS response-associated peptidase YedK
VNLNNETSVLCGSSIAIPHHNDNRARREASFYTFFMCGRFRLARKKEILEAAFGAEEALDDLDWVPRYNVAPGQEILAVRQNATEPVRRLSPMLWGLIPSWANDPSIGYKTINARAETVAERPSFREPLRSRRCLILADGFYEWRREGKQKLPFCFTLTGEPVFAFAGLWDRWRSPQGAQIESCTILTTGPNELMQDVHDRMPVILDPEDYDLWLDPRFTKIAELAALLKPYPAGAMRRYRVSQRVNQVQNDDAECAAEIEAA